PVVAPPPLATQHLLLLFVCHRHAPHRDLHSFPTRRSSDLALGGEFVNATGWGGWVTGTDGPMRMLYDCENVRTVVYGAKTNTPRSEEHTSELQSLAYLVCRLLLEKKKGTGREPRSDRKSET